MLSRSCRNTSRLMTARNSMMRSFGINCFKRTRLKSDDLGRLEIGASLQTRELRVADRGEDDAEERLADTGNAAQQQVARVHLPLFVLVVGGRNLRQQDDVGERLRRLVSDERLA